MRSARPAGRPAAAAIIAWRSASSRSTGRPWIDADGAGVGPPVSQSASWALKSAGEAKAAAGQERGLEEPVVALDHALELRVPRRGQPDPAWPACRRTPPPAALTRPVPPIADSRSQTSVLGTRPSPQISCHIPDRMSPACRDGIIVADSEPGERQRHHQHRQHPLLPHRDRDPRLGEPQVALGDLARLVDDPVDRVDPHVLRADPGQQDQPNQATSGSAMAMAEDPVAKAVGIAERQQRVHALLPEGMHATVHVTGGDPVDVLEQASRTVDLLVCGSRGRGPLRTIVLGGVSGRLAHRAASPLIVLPRTPSAIAAGGTVPGHRLSRSSRSPRAVRRGS